jgi:hypothetical protein
MVLMVLTRIYTDKTSVLTLSAALEYGYQQPFLEIIDLTVSGVKHGGDCGLGLFQN